MARNFANKIVSPYAPRPRRSAQLIILWVTCFLFILLLTWYITTRHRETAQVYADGILRPQRPKKMN